MKNQQLSKKVSVIGRLCVTELNRTVSSFDNLWGGSYHTSVTMCTVSKRFTVNQRYLSVVLDG